MKTDSLWGTKRRIPRKTKIDAFERFEKDESLERTVKKGVSGSIRFGRDPVKICAWIALLAS